MDNKITSDTLRTLSEIKKKGYIFPKADAIKSHYQRINHALADFFKASPINPQDATACMTHLAEICKNTPAFFSLFPKTMMDLYDWAITGDELTQTRAETNLLLFFLYVSPPTIEQKNRLLQNILNMPDFSQRKKQIAKVAKLIANHYDQNQQFNEDPGLNVLTPLSFLLHRVIPLREHPAFDLIQEKASFARCASHIKKHSPKLYDDSWFESFASSPPRRISIPRIKEAPEVYFPYRNGTPSPQAFFKMVEPYSK